MPDDISVTYDGLEELRARLQRMGREFAGTLGGTLQQAMKRSLYMLIFTLAKYPKQVTKPGNIPYRRTGTLGRKWTEDIEVQRVLNGLRGRIGNNTPYAPRVQADRYQRPWHRRHGWETDKSALNVNMPKIVREFDRASAEIVNK